MKRTRARDSSSIFFISKWVVIVALVIVCWIGFILGYYVGKRSLPADNNQLSVVPTDNFTVQNDGEPSDQESTLSNLETEKETRSPEATQTVQEPLNTHQTKQTAEVKHNQAPLTRQKPQPPRTETTNITYTVQAGAFRSALEASTLKEKLGKKGYTAYIIQSETKKHEKLYKVMIGKFSTRKQAEILSLKIKKAEGLQTFVTFRTKEDVLR